MSKIIFISLIACFLHPEVQGHVGLTFPPARTYALDYLTSYSDAPCGMPRTEGAPATTFIEGTTFTATWQLSYPHAGGNKLELLKEEGPGNYRVVAFLSAGEGYSFRNDTTIQQMDVTLPKGVLCNGCTFRLLREGAEYGSSYFFLSCADITIVERPDGSTELATTPAPSLATTTVRTGPDPFKWIRDWIADIEDDPNMQETVQTLRDYLRDIDPQPVASSPQPESYPYLFGHTQGITALYEGCFEGKCLNGGTCESDTGACQCHRLFTGDRCQFKDECWTSEDCSFHGECIDTRSTSFPKLQCYCRSGWFGVECEKVSALTEVRDDFDSNPDYSSAVLYPGIVFLYWRYTSDMREIEMAIRVKSRSWVGIGWRPRDTRRSCKILDPVLSVEAKLSAIQEELIRRQVSYTTTEPNPSEDPEAAIEEQLGSNIERRCVNRRRNKRQANQRVYGGMDCADMVVGAVKGNLHRMRDMFTPDCSRPEADEFYGGTNGLTAAVGKQDGEYTTLFFRKKATSNHYSDHAVSPSVEMTVLFARGQEIQRNTVGAWARSCKTGDPRFYRHDELKYHGYGRGNKGSTTMTFTYSAPVSTTPSPSPTPCTTNAGSFQTSNGRTTVSWVLKNDFITFSIKAQQEAGRYVALGISADTFMPRTDIYTAFVNAQGQITVQDRYASRRELPPVDETQEIGDVSGSYTGGVLSVKFTRPRLSQNSDDLGFDQCRYLLFATGVVVNNDITYHDARQVLGEACISSCATS